MIVEVLQRLVDQLLDPSRDALFMILVVVFELHALRPELVELHEACECLVEVEDLFARLVRQLVAGRPDVLRTLAQHHEERLDLGDTPNLLLLMLDRVVQCILLQVLRLDIHIDRQIRVNVSLDPCDLGEILLVPRNFLFLVFFGLLSLVL